MVGEQKQDAMIAPALGAIGSVMLLVGAFLTWASASVDLNKLGQALGVDLSKIPVAQLPQTVAHVAGVRGWEGKLAVAAGVIGVAGVVMSLQVRKKGAPLLLVAGAAGAFAAIFALSYERTNAINDASAKFASSGLPGKVTDYVSITFGIGLWLCLIAGLLCLAAGAMALMGTSSETAAPPMMSDSGFGGTAPAPMRYQAPTPAPAPTPYQAPTPTPAPSPTTDPTPPPPADPAPGIS